MGCSFREKMEIHTHTGLWQTAAGNECANLPLLAVRAVDGAHDHEVCRNPGLGCYGSCRCLNWFQIVAADGQKVSHPGITAPKRFIENACRRRFVLTGSFVPAAGHSAPKAPKDWGQLSSG